MAVIKHNSRGVGGVPRSSEVVFLNQCFVKSDVVTHVGSANLLRDVRILRGRVDKIIELNQFCVIGR